MTIFPSLVLNNVTLLGNVQTVQELSDVLVADLANLLDIGSALRHALQRVTRQDKLILLVLRQLDIDAFLHDDSADNLLADKVSDLHLPQTGLFTLVQVHVDGEMCVNIAHFIFEALGDADDHVLDD